MAQKVFNAENGSFYIDVKGLKDLVDWAKKADPEFKKAMNKGLKAAAQPVLQRAKSKATAIQDDGTYKNSLTISQRKNGSQYLLRSTDPAAPVKEYARPGAKTRTSKGTKLADSRLRMRSGVGVPHRANAPRVMVPAVNESADEVMARMENAIADVLKEAENG